jgi:2-oxo-4-hydroxy-4-carboxy--5-ureidoimidazoline (OHCU) decarboxylase
MSEEEQVELVDAHPRLGAPPATVSAMSFREQGYDRDTGTPNGPGTPATPGTPGAPATPGTQQAAVATELERLNDAYEACFGFRYCVFVAGRPREALLPGMAAALQQDRDAELHRALDAVIDIAMDRHANLAAESDPT